MSEDLAKPGWKQIPIAGIPFKKATEYHTGDWRTFKPVIDQSKCTKCLTCWIFCPDDSIVWDGNTVQVDYRYCKGCGICAEMCPVKAITMVKEE